MSGYLARNVAVIAVLILGLAWAVPVRADELDRFKAENELKAQKLKTEVKAALAQAGALVGTDPVKARDTLRQVQGRLEDDVVLPDRVRTELLQQVRERLRMVIQAVRAREAEEEAAAQKAAVRLKERQRREAERQAQKVKSPSAVASDYINSSQNLLNAAQRLKLSKEKGHLGVMDSIDQSLVDGMKEQRITQRFVRATQLRMNKMSPKEVALLKALNSVMSVDYNNSPFREVIDHLQERTGQNIILDEGSLKDAMVEKDDPVTFKAKKIMFRTILRKVLADKGLTYVILEGTLQVVTPQKARDMMVVRTYPVGDLVNPITPVGPFFNQFISAQNALGLIESIKSSVDPTIWEQGATIAYNPVLRAIIIRAPAEVHYGLGFGAGYGGR